MGQLTCSKLEKMKITPCLLKLDEVFARWRSNDFSQRRLRGNSGNPD